MDDALVPQHGALGPRGFWVGLCDLLSGTATCAAPTGRAERRVCVRPSARTRSCGDAQLEGGPARPRLRAPRPADRGLARRRQPTRRMENAHSQISTSSVMRSSCSCALGEASVRRATCTACASAAMAAGPRRSRLRSGWRSYWVARTRMPGLKASGLRGFGWVGGGRSMIWASREVFDNGSGLGHRSASDAAQRGLGGTGRRKVTPLWASA